MPRSNSGSGSGTVNIGGTDITVTMDFFFGSFPASGIPHPDHGRHWGFSTFLLASTDTPGVTIHFVQILTSETVTINGKTFRMRIPGGTHTGLIDRDHTGNLGFSWEGSPNDTNTAARADNAWWGGLRNCYTADASNGHAGIDTHLSTGDKVQNTRQFKTFVFAVKDGKEELVGVEMYGYTTDYTVGSDTSSTTGTTTSTGATLVTSGQVFEDCKKALENARKNKQDGLGPPQPYTSQ